MDSIHKSRLEEIARFLYTLPKEKFNIEDFVSEAEGGCGTVCCAIGWFPQIFPRNFKWVKREPNSILSDELHVTSVTDNKGVAVYSHFLGLVPEQLFHLFYAGQQDGEQLTKNTTPRQLAAHIRKFIRGV
jgi:hypothetical protein